MHLIRLLLELIQLEREHSHKLDKVLEFSKRFDLREQALAERIFSIKSELSFIAKQVEQIWQSLIPELVTAVKLVDETGDQMEIEVGKPRQFRVDTFGASGNPTVPVGAPTLTLTDTSSFTADSAALTMVPTGAEGSSTDITVTVDGVTSPALSYTIKAEGPPPAEPVNSVVLVDVTP